MTDITRKRGDTHAIEVAVVSEVTGLAIDITGATFLMTVDPEKAPLTADNNLFQLTGVITNATGGLVEFRPSLANADNLGNYYHDIQMTDSAGQVRTIDAGKFKLVQDITK